MAARVEKLEGSHSRPASGVEVLAEDLDRIAREVKEMKGASDDYKARDLDFAGAITIQVRRRAFCDRIGPSAPR